MRNSLMLLTAHIAALVATPSYITTGYEFLKLLYRLMKTLICAYIPSLLESTKKSKPYLRRNDNGLVTREVSNDITITLREKYNTQPHKILVRNMFLTIYSMCIYHVKIYTHN